MAKETKSGSKPAVSKKTTKSASAKKTTTKSTTKSASAAKARTPKRTSVSKTTTKAASAKATTSKAKKPVQKSISPGGAAPMVDTNFAAQAAARMLATRAKLAKATGNTGHGEAAPAAGDASNEAHHESGLFKQMKESINKPAAGGISSAMGNTFGPNKTNLPNPDKGHVVRDQTTSNVNRVNVPRRTGG